MRFFVEFSLCFILISMSISCEREEIPIIPHEPGDVMSAQVNMESDYRNQVFFDLSSNSVISENHKTDWDIGFESKEEGWHIILNSSRAAAAYNSQSMDFNTSINIDDINWSYDVPSGNLDSTAVGDYRNTGLVYIINRGYSPSGTHTGYKKIIFNAYSDSTYTISIADIDGENDTMLVIHKNLVTNFTCFSLNNYEVVNIEPNNQSWDLLFTQYTHLFYNPFTPYLVSGVLINRNDVSVFVDTLNEFLSITYEDVLDYEYSYSIDEIGFDWKFYDFNTGKYSIIPNRSYILRDHEENYYKINFTDFYDPNGLKGSPAFQFQKL